MITRRNFLKTTAAGVAGIALPLAAFEIVDPKKLMAEEAKDKAKVRWVFLVDTYKCVGCGLCVKACKAGERSSLRCERNADLGRAVRDHQGRQGPMPTHPRGLGTVLRPRRSTSAWASSRTSTKRTSIRPSSCPSCATSARILPACRSARSARRIRRATASCWWTGTGASAADTASWAVPMACGSSTRSIILPRNATSAIIASRKA